MFTKNLFSINWSHALNRGLVRWYLHHPNRIKATALDDIAMGLYPLSQQSMDATNWIGAAGRPGGHSNSSFNGSTNYLLGSDAGLPSGSGLRTICGWYFYRAIPSNPNLVLTWDYGTHSNNQAWVFGVDGRNLFGNGRFFVSNWGKECFSTIYPSANTWYHVAIVYTGSVNIDVYVNGALDNATDISGGSVNTTLSGNFSLGAQWDGSNFSNVYLDDIRIYDRALTSSEIFALYAESLSGYPRLLNRKRFIFSSPGATTHNRTISDTIGVSDNVARNWIANRLISDTLGLSDAVTASKGATSYNRTITDTIGVSDNVLRTWIANRLLSDSLGLSDNVERQQIANRLISDTLGASDNTLRTWIANRLISDTLGISDLPTATTGAHNRTISDSLGISDNVQRTWIANRLISDTLGVSDNLARAWIAQRLISDQLGISDLPITQLQEPGGLTHNRTLSDTLGISDNVERQQIVLRVLSDVLGLSDSFDRVAVFNRLVSDTLAVSDNIQRSVIYLRLLADTLGISDSITATTIAEAELFVGSATTQRTGIVGAGTTQRTGIVGAATVARAQSDSAS